MNCECFQCRKYEIYSLAMWSSCIWLISNHCFEETMIDKYECITNLLECNKCQNRTKRSAFMWSSQSIFFIKYIVIENKIAEEDSYCEQCFNKHSFISSFRITVSTTAGLLETSVINEQIKKKQRQEERINKRKNY